MWVAVLRLGLSLRRDCKSGFRWDGSLMGVARAMKVEPLREMGWLTAQLDLAVGSKTAVAGEVCVSVSACVSAAEPVAFTLPPSSSCPPTVSSPCHSYPPLLSTATSLPMIFTLGCPSPHPSSSALGPLSSPILTALDLELALTTACAKLSLLESGCSGMVYRSSSTANARTSGALLVSMTVLAMRSSSMHSGSSSERSSSWGVISTGPLANRSVLARFARDAAASGAPCLAPPLGADEARFRAALHAFCSALAPFSSLSADCTAARGASAICLMLRAGHEPVSYSPCLSSPRCLACRRPPGRRRSNGLLTCAGRRSGGP